MTKWQGTPVPNTGYVDKVYFNTNLNFDEVVKILDELTYVSLEDSNPPVDSYFVLCSSNEEGEYIFIDKFSDGNYSICNASDNIFSTEEMPYGDSKYIGWNPFITNSIVINSEVANVDLYSNIPAGLENDKLASLFSTTPFVQEKVTLNSFLTGIADAIRSKKGTTEPINASNFASEIESISGSGGAGAVIKKTGVSFPTTPVPISGLVEKIYINTSLSTEEVVAICETLNFITYGDVIWACFTDMTLSNALIINKVQTDNINNYIINVMINKNDDPLQIPIFDSAKGGWSSEITPSMLESLTEFNSENYLYQVGPFLGFTPENEKATNLFSITPFGKEPDVEIILSGEYDGTDIIIDELPKSKIIGTAVPSSGQVDNIYINTKLSIEEVVSICSNLTFVDGSSVASGWDIWSCATNSVLTNGIMVARNKYYPDIYAITVNNNGESNQIFLSTTGWAALVSNVFEFNDNNQISVVGPMLGLTPENEKATTLFSITPFKETEDNVIYLESYIKEQKIPLEFKINKDCVITNGNIDITANGEYDVNTYKKAIVNVPLPEGTVVPSGRKYITQAKVDIDVSQYKYAYISDNAVQPRKIAIGETILGVQGTAKTLKNFITKKGNANYLFYQHPHDNLTELINYEDTAGARYLENTFAYCTDSKTFPSINTSYVNSFYRTYYGCLMATDIPPLLTEASWNMSEMFYNCSNLKKIDISYYYKTEPELTSEWCSGCASLKAVIIRQFSDIEDSFVLNANAFDRCNHLNGTIHDYYNPEGLKDGYIYVPRNMIETLQTAENWSTLQFRALEDYTVDGTTTGEFIVPRALPEDCVEILTDKKFAMDEPDTQTISMSLKEFINIPSVNVISDNENIVVSNINATLNAITFDITKPAEECSANIEVTISGDLDMSYSFNVKYYTYTEPTYEVKAIDGVTYGFELNSNGYYESTNAGKTYSYSMCYIDINNPNTDGTAKIILDCINYAEAGADYAIISKLDSPLDADKYVTENDEKAILQSFKQLNSKNVQEVSCVLPNGNHTMYIKYKKDSWRDSYNDSFQFKVRFEVA